MDRTLRPALAQRILAAPYGRVVAGVIQRVDDAPIVVRTAIAFVAVLVLVSSFPARPATQTASRPRTLSTPAPYVTCGIDHTFSVKSGRCVRVNPAPLPCVRNSRGGCMPTGATVRVSKPEPAPEPVREVREQPADPFAGIMGIRKN